MSLVWRKIQRSNKKAAKFRFAAQFQELSIQCSKKWQPSKVSVAWVHRRRRYFTKEHKWEPTITDPYRGLIIWPASNPELLEITTTLYRDSRPDSSFDDKEWTFIVEETNNRGRRKPIAGVNLNMRLFVNEIPGTQTELKLKLKPLCEHLIGCQLQLVLTCTIVKEGDANDEDMRSVASVMSVQHPVDIARMEDIEDEFGSGNSFGSNSMDSPHRYSSNNQISSKFAEVTTKIDALTEHRDSFRESPSNNRPAQEPNSSYSFSRVSVEFTKTGAEPVRPAVAGSHGRNTSTPKSTVNDNRMVNNDSGIADDYAAAPSRQSDSETTSQDLLSWCQTVTKKYKRVKITDFSSSWRNGLAFCALIHHFRPDLVDFDSLNTANIRENCSLAFESASNLGIPKLIDPSDMVIMAIPDKIAIMTYVYMLRNHFTGQPMPDHQQNQQHHSSPKYSVSNVFQENLHTPQDTVLSNGSSTAAVDSQVVFRSSAEKSVENRESFSSSNKRHESRRSSGRETSTSGLLSKIKARKSSSGTSSERSSHAGSPVNNTEHLALTLSTENIQKPVLMTRNQLMNPFDSDEEAKMATGGAAVATPNSAESSVVCDSFVSNNIPSHPVAVTSSADAVPPVVEAKSPTNAYSTTNSVAVAASPSTASISSSTTRQDVSSRQEELKRRTRELLEQFQHDRERTPDDDERRKELKERARRLIEEATSSSSSSQISQTQQQRVVKISETLNFKKGANVGDSSKAAMTSSSLDDAHVPVVQKAQSAPTTRNVTPDSKNLRLTKNNPTSPVDFYQFGEKRAPPPSSPVITKESLLNQTGRSRRPYPNSTVKQEVSLSSGESAMDRFKRFGSMRGQELAQSINILSSRVSQTVRSASESEGRSRGQLMAEMEDVSNKTKELNRKATEVEKRWRQVMQDASGSEEEQKLMNEYLSLLNERNMLTRREMHLSLLENISDQESRFQMVQKDLGELIQIDDSEKTEDHKQQIDRLMEELINIVNKRDELVQQLLAHEQGTEEDAELANDVMSQSNLLPSEDKDGCSIQ